MLFPVMLIFIVGEVSGAGEKVGGEKVFSCSRREGRSEDIRGEKKPRTQRPYSISWDTV